MTKSKKSKQGLLKGSKISSREACGEIVETRVKEFYSANMIKVEVGTTGFCDGDAGHGGRTYFSIIDLGCTAMSCQIFDGRREMNFDNFDNDGFGVVLGGDTELMTFLDALKFAVDVLEMQIRKRKREDA
jgi:hypothetical protein